MKLDDVYRLFKVEAGKEDEFLERIGYGIVTLPAIVARIVEEERRREKEREERLQGLANLCQTSSARVPAPTGMAAVHR